jgi:glutathione-independent formaldehyde dehydrogenase
VVLNQMMEITRAAGNIGIPGLYVTDDPGAIDEAAKVGSLSLRFGKAWSKAHSLHTGQTPVLKYNRMLMQAILYDRVNIAEIVNAKVITLEDAPQGYEAFDAGAASKYVIDPHGMIARAA